MLWAKSVIFGEESLKNSTLFFFLSLLSLPFYVRVVLFRLRFFSVLDCAIALFGVAVVEEYTLFKDDFGKLILEGKRISLPFRIRGVAIDGSRKRISLQQNCMRGFLSG